MQVEESPLHICDLERPLQELEGASPDQASEQAQQAAQQIREPKIDRNTDINCVNSESSGQEELLQPPSTDQGRAAPSELSNKRQKMDDYAAEIAAIDAVYAKHESEDKKIELEPAQQEAKEENKNEISTADICPRLMPEIWRRILSKTDFRTCLLLGETVAAKIFLPEIQLAQREGKDWPQELLEYFMELGLPGPVQFLRRHDIGIPRLDIASYMGNLDMMKALYNPKLRGTRDAVGPREMINAASNGNLNIVQYLYENVIETHNTHAMDAAAANNQLNILMYLHGKEHEGLTEQAMTLAAYEGHLEVVQWLYHNTEVGDPVKAMDAAAAGGYLEVVLFFHENCEKGCTTDAMDEAARNNQVHILSFLQQNRPEGCSENALNLAASANAVEAFQWLLHNRSEYVVDEAMIIAAAKGHWEILMLLHEELRLESCSQDAMHFSALNNHLGIMQWLKFHTLANYTPRVIEYAAQGGHLDIVRTLHEHLVRECVPVTHQEDWQTHMMESIKRAHSGGKKEVVDWLREHCHLLGEMTDEELNANPQFYANDWSTFKTEKIKDRYSEVSTLKGWRTDNEYKWLHQRRDYSIQLPIPKPENQDPTSDGEESDHDEDSDSDDNVPPPPPANLAAPNQAGANPAAAHDNEDEEVVDPMQEDHGDADEGEEPPPGGWMDDFGGAPAYAHHAPDANSPAQPALTEEQMLANIANAADFMDLPDELMPHPASSAEPAADNATEEKAPGKVTIQDGNNNAAGESADAAAKKMTVQSAPEPNADNAAPEAKDLAPAGEKLNANQAASGSGNPEQADASQAKADIGNMEQANADQAAQETKNSELPENPATQTVNNA